MANLSAAKAEAQLAANTERRFRRLREQGNTSKQLYDEAKLNFQSKKAQYEVAQANVKRAQAAANATNIALAEAAIKAPFNGIIQSRYMDEGTQILGGTPALKLIEVGPIKAHIGIPSASKASLTINQTYSIRWNDIEQSAQLTAISPEVDPNTRTLNAVFKIPANTIPIGAVVELLLAQQVASPGFWVPVSASPLAIAVCGVFMWLTPKILLSVGWSKSFTTKPPAPMCAAYSLIATLGQQRCTTHSAGPKRTAHKSK